MLRAPLCVSEDCVGVRVLWMERTRVVNYMYASAIRQQHMY
jgi:hypothetical protein